MISNVRLARIALLIGVQLWLNISLFAAPEIVFTPLTNGQTVVNLSAIGGSFTNGIGAVTSVVYSVHEADINGGMGRWWNGSRYQPGLVTLPAQITGTNWSPMPGAIFPQLNSGQPYELAVTATDASNETASAQITVNADITSLNWDSGVTPAGTVFLQRPNTNGGNYWFKITTQNTTVGAWRTVLKVMAGEADVFMSYGSPQNTNGANFISRRVGPDGFVLHSSQFDAGQDWYILVQATTNAQWSLLTGEAYVYDLGPLATNSASSTNVTMGAEGMALFKTTIDANALAWSLWLQGSNNPIRVRKSAAPHPASYNAGEPVPQSGQMLVVPDYLAGAVFNGYYFVTVEGVPGETVRLDSRKQTATDIAFTSTNAVVTVTNVGYRIYRIQVPVQQIAWQVSVVPGSGNPNFAVRRDKVPNEWNNDAFSEAPGLVTDSLTLVPPTLSDGTFYITVYGAAPYSFTLKSLNPVVTDVPFLGASTNDDLNRVGWRFYRVIDITNQLGNLGWALLLQNAPVGTEIALRRNAVPGRWNYRANNDGNTYTPDPAPLDYSSSNGELQRPGHQADIWYVGVYNPTNALNAFTLIRQLLIPQTVSFQSTTSRTNVNSGHWEFFRIDVPTNSLGWDVRLVNVTNGSPRMVMRRDLLPDGQLVSGPYPYSWWYYQNPWAYTSWSSGSQWLSGEPENGTIYPDDWTGDWNNSDGSDGHVNTIACGMGNPLEAGTYYVGVSANGISSYTLQSRGIGTGWVIPVTTLSHAGGAATNTLAAREAAYYRVVIASNTPSWKVRLTPTSGEVLLLVQKDALPNIVSGGSVLPNSGWPILGGKKMQKAGNEQYVLLPADGQTNLPAGTYYLAVVGEGVNPDPSQHWIGAGSSVYTLQSQGALPIANLGTVAIGNDLVTSNTLQGGEVAAYQFNAPSNTTSVEVWLGDRTGNPALAVVNNLGLPAPNDGYGADGGYMTGRQTDYTLITAPNPNGTYSVVVQAASPYADATYTLRIKNVPPIPANFDGGMNVVTDQTDRTWKFFVISIPTNALGWDMRLVDVTNGSPRMVVRRDLLPDGLVSGPYPYSWWYYQNPWDYTSWSSDSQWLSGEPENGTIYPDDWTGDWNNSDGSDGHVNTIACGMGNPLEPGIYYVGVYANGISSYSLQSRGIGTGLVIPVTTLSFGGGAATNTLPAREAAYYRVVIASNTPSWKVRLTPTGGEALLLAQKDALPNVVSDGSALPNYGWPILGGKKMQKAANEQYVLLPSDRQTNIPAGTYYLAVVSEGMNPNPSQHSIGTNGCDYVLQSHGSLPVLDMGSVTVGNDLVLNHALQGGEVAAYQFHVPANTASVEVRLEGSTGSPALAVVNGTGLPRPADDVWNGGRAYGQDGGYKNDRQADYNLITMANPVGTYSVVVQATYPYSDATYTLRIKNVPPTPVSFDGGASAVTDQPDRTWKFFAVDVPTNALGWDVRLVNVNNGNPRMVVRRDLLPEGLVSGPYPYSWWYYQNPWDYTSWSSGSQWLSGEPYYHYYPYLPTDWTGDYYNADGSDGHINTIACGMGNPLEAGTYYIGVYAGGASSYTLQSRGIGTGLAIPITTLSFAGGAATNTLLAREAAYYRVVIASNTPSWKVRLTPTGGEALLLAQKDALPNIVSGSVASIGSALGPVGGKKIQKAGNEQYVLLPSDGQTNIPAGTYFLAVVGEGVNPDPVQRRIGTGGSDFVLQSQGVLPVAILGTAMVGSDLVASNALQGGEVAAYQFNVLSNTPSVEVRLEDRVGNPALAMINSTGIPRPPDDTWNNGAYGEDGGYAAGRLTDYNLITVPNPTGVFSVVVQAVSPFSDATYKLRVRSVLPPLMNFTAAQNTNGLTNVVTGLLADNQRTYFRIQVPATNSGIPFIGWKLDLTMSQGSASVRVRKNLLPDDSSNDTSPYSSPSAYIVPTYLTPGNWYVEVRGSGATTFALTSSALLPERTWIMPQPGQPTTTPGLSGLEFGDSGTGTNGNPILDPQTGTVTDRGLDLQQGRFHYYSISLPTNNAGLFRTILEAISGTPELYLREGLPATLSHSEIGAFDGYHPELVDRRQTGAATKYGNWVALDGKYATNLTSGVWYLAVRAAGNSNARYRLHVAQGNVQDLTLNGGSYTNQLLVGGDWRYYRVQIPSNAPANWNVTFGQQVGDVVLYLRDTVPPGFGTDPTSPQYRDWASDQKNHGPYPNYDPPGTYSLTEPPLRPGHTYYLGVRAVSDATFSVSSSTSGGVFHGTNTIAFYGGYVTNVIPPHGALLYRINVPGDAARWVSYATHDGNVQFYLEQGTVPMPVPYNSHRWTWPSDMNVNWDIDLLAANNWPWMPNQSYFLLATNSSATPQPFSFLMNGIRQATPLPVLANLTLAGTNFIVYGTNGPAGATYYLLASTNLALPLINWTRLATNTFDANGNFIFTNSVNPTHPQRFYLLQLP